VFDSIGKSVEDADAVILASPIRTFEMLMADMADSLKPGCIVTDVGSTKTLPHRWAKENLPKEVFYVGSHPIAGSEKRGLEFARDDLFTGAKCIVTKMQGTDKESVETIKNMWSSLGCAVEVMTPARHDSIYSAVSHLPHMAAAALLNASEKGYINFAGKGFIDTSRVASGPANIWTDIVMTNRGNIADSIDMFIKELEKIRNAVDADDEDRVYELLERARKKREALINYKIKKRELI